LRASTTLITVDVSELPTGIYFARLRSGDDLLTARFTKQ
jgi:hypothetical protein